MMHNSTNSQFFRESKSHGSKDYPIEYYTCTIPESYRYMCPHWHEELEITFIASGKLNYVIDQECLEVSEGDLLLIGPDTLHAAQQIDSIRAQTNTIVFHLNLVGLAQKDRCSQKYIQPFFEHKILPYPIVRPDSPYYSSFLQCYQNLWENQTPDHGTELLVKSTLFQLMYQVWKLTPKQPSAYYSPDVRRNIEKLKPVLSYIHEHYSEPLTIDMLAKISGFSSVHFMNIFKKYINTPCMEYILHYRINAASEALKETDHSIMKIAMDHGFQNISYFNRKFKAFVGCTPSQYRKNYQK